MAVRRLPLPRAFAAVLANACCFSLREEERKRRMMHHYLELTARVPVWEVRFRPGLERLPAILDGIERAVRAGSPGRHERSRVMTDLSRCSVLQRVPDLRVDIDSSGNLRIRTPGGNVACGPHGLAVLDAFSRPTSVSGALETLQTRVAGAQEWMDLTGTVVRLYKAGVLREEGRAGPALGSDASAYDAAPIHVAMLNDRARTSRFLAAIREVVRPGDVVVDVGTGTGVLAIAAARAGARHVYAVEASGMGRSARAVFEANGLGERITLVQGWSTRISLPERADRARERVDRPRGAG